MGYDIHITRANDWTDSESTPITREEWLEQVAADSSIGPDPENGEDDFLWLAHPIEPWSLWWYRGEVYTKDPDIHTIKKMAGIARLLHARVQGDDREIYDETGVPKESER